MKINIHLRIKAVNRILKRLNEYLDKIEPYGYEDPYEYLDKIEYWEYILNNLKILIIK